MYALKKLFPKLICFFVGAVAGLALSLFLYALSSGTFYRDLFGLDFCAIPREDVSFASNAELSDIAYDVLRYMQNGDFSALADAVHPVFGVVFSPYATVSLSSNRCFTPDQIAAFGHDKSVYFWGVYDGKETPIELTPQDYFNRFVFDKDFTKAPLVGLDQIVKSGNALENFSEAFPNARFVDFHMPGNGAESDDLGWSSLRLGFEDYDGTLKLTVILHSEWTV